MVVKLSSLTGCWFIGHHWSPGHLPVVSKDINSYWCGRILLYLRVLNDRSKLITG